MGTDEEEKERLIRCVSGAAKKGAERRINQDGMLSGPDEVESNLSSILKTSFRNILL